jgi:hypothetical protein
VLPAEGRPSVLRPTLGYCTPPLSPAGCLLFSQLSHEGQATVDTARGLAAPE